MILTAVWAFGHILSAMAWLGGGLFFSFFIAGKFPRLSPAALREFIVKLQPAIIQFFQAAAGLTIVFGLLLVANMADGDYAQFSHPTGWALYITVGMVLAFVAFLLSEFIAAPRFKKLVQIVASTPEGTTSMPPEFGPAAKQAGMISLVLLFFLLATLGAMVAAGFY